MSCSLATLNGGLGGAVEAHTLLCLEKKMVRNVHSKKIGNDDADYTRSKTMYYVKRRPSFSFPLQIQRLHGRVRVQQKPLYLILPSVLPAVVFVRRERPIHRRMVSCSKRQTNGNINIGFPTMSLGFLFVAAYNPRLKFLCLRVASSTNFLYLMRIICLWTIFFRNSIVADSLLLTISLARDLGKMSILRTELSVKGSKAHVCHGQPCPFS